MNLPITRNFLPLTSPLSSPAELRIARDPVVHQSWTPEGGQVRPMWTPPGPSGGSQAREDFAAATDTLTGDLYSELRNTGGLVEGEFIPAFDELARIRHRIRQGEPVSRDELRDAVAAAREGLQQAMANHDGEAFHVAAQRAIGVLDDLSFEDGDTALTALLDGAQATLSEALESGGLVSDLVNTATDATPDHLQIAMHELVTRMEAGDVSLGELRRELASFRSDLRPLANGGSNAATALLAFLDGIRPLERSAVFEQLQNGSPVAAHLVLPRGPITP